MTGGFYVNLWFRDPYQDYAVGPFATREAADAHAAWEADSLVTVTVEQQPNVPRRQVIAP